MPSPTVGWFDGLPWSTPQEIILLLFILPPVVIAAREIFSKALLFQICGALVFLKVLLWTAFPPAGLNLRIYESPEQFAQGNWEKTWDTIWHGRQSALIRRDLRDTREFPMEWVNRLNQLGSVAKVKERIGAAPEQVGVVDGLTPSDSIRLSRYSGNEKIAGEALRKTLRPMIELEGWIYLKEKERLVVALDKLTDPGSLHLKDATGRSVARTWGLEKQELLFSAVSSGWHFFGGTAVMPPLEELDTNLRIRIQDSNGRQGKPWMSQKIWISIPNGPPALVLFSAQAVSRLIDGLVLLGFGWLWICGMKQILNSCGGVQCFLLLSLGVLIGWGVLALGLTFPKSISLAAFCSCLGGLILFRGLSGAFPLKPWHLFLILSVAAGPLFVRQWWAELPRMSFFSIGDDWLTFQNQARHIFIQQDWLNLKSDPIYANQPGSRYWIGLGHLLFGQSAFSTRMIDFWSVLGTACLLSATALRLGSKPGAAWLAGGLAAAVFFWPPAGDLIGRGLQEPLAAAALAAVLYRVACSPTKGSPDWIMAFWVCWAFWLRMDHLPVLFACGLFFLAPGSGRWGELPRVWLSSLKKNLGKLAWLGFWIFFAVTAVVGRNLVAGNGLTLTSGRHMASKFAVSFWQSLEMPGLILRADSFGTRAISPMGWFLIGGMVLAVVGLLFRAGWVRRLPVQPCFLFLAALAPYFLMREFAYAPRFSFHFVPVAGLLWAVFLSTRNLEPAGALRPARIPLG
jgi:hypothetical protein